MNDEFDLIYKAYKRGLARSRAIFCPEFVLSIILAINLLRVPLLEKFLLWLAAKTDDRIPGLLVMLVSTIFVYWLGHLIRKCFGFKRIFHFQDYT